MKHRMKCLSVSLLLALFACASKDEVQSGFQRKAAEPVDGIRIAWDFSSISQLADKGGYPRLLRLKDSSLVAVYEDYEGNTRLIRSYDNGLTWSTPQITFSQFSYSNEKGESTLVNMSNPEVYQLANGDIVLGCNYRPQKTEIAPYSIAIKRSTDNGHSWHESQILYNAAPRFTDGCWEPSFLQLPDGELQVYFANENPYQNSDEQEISMLSSKDNGVTWSDKVKTVSFRQNRRDGMPVARIVNDEIVLAIEDNNVDKFKPYTVRTKINDNWSAPVLANSPNRKYALKESIPDYVYMGAPYLLKLPTGETVISYQTTENRSSDWELSTMEVAVGDNEGRKFSLRTRPFDVPVNKEAKWNSIAMWDQNTVVALASTNFKSVNVAPCMIKGYIIPRITVTTKDITQYPIFIGSKGNTSLRAGLGSDESNVYINCKVKDEALYAHSSDKQKADGVYICLDVENASIASLDKGIYKLWCNYKGDIATYEGDNGIWKSISASDIQVSASQRGDGYDLNITIPKQKIVPFNERAIRIGMALSAYKDGMGYVEPITNSELETPNTWLKIEF